MPQRHVFTRARLHQLPVFAENVAKRDVAEIDGLVSFPASDLEYLFKMQSLWRANHVPNCVALQFGDSIINRRDVAGGVIESAVALANDARLVRQLGNITKENDDRAFANLGDAGLKQPLDDAGQAIVVKAFATLDVVMNVEELVNVLEILHRERDALVPDVSVFFVAGLELDQFLAARISHRRIGCRSCVGFFINANDLGQRIALERLSIKQIFPAPDHHSKLRAPIANVIVANHVVTEKGRDSRERVPKCCAANVTYMHRLGHIGRPEIDHDFLWRCRPCDPQSLVGEWFRCFVGDGAVQ